MQNYRAIFLKLFLPIFSTKMKNQMQPTRAIVSTNLQCKIAPHLFGKFFFTFSYTEHGEEKNNPVHGEAKSVCREIQTPSQQWLKTVFSHCRKQQQQHNCSSRCPLSDYLHKISRSRHYNVDRIKGKATQFVPPGVDYLWQLSEGNPLSAPLGKQ